MSGSQQLLLGTGAGGAAPVYIEDVFQTWVYAGTGATQSINNGIDLTGKGGLVWTKRRSGSSASSHILIDTARGADNGLATDQSIAQTTGWFPTYFTGFTSTGYGVGGAAGENNATSSNYASWTFRKQAKFFDVVTYTGNGAASRNISHSLGSVPGCIIVKSTSAAYNWYVYHRSTGNTQALILNLPAAAAATGAWNNTTPTSTVFTVDNTSEVNENGKTYVAYLFAHDAGGFGAAGTDNVITCGSFTTDGSGNATVTLGYEPQWTLIKRSDSSSGGNWRINDSMRNMVAAPNLGDQLFPNLANGESIGNGVAQPTSTGFTTNNGAMNPSATYIYIAIRRGPMKTPTSGTSVFEPVARTSNSTNPNLFNTSLSYVDMSMNRARATAGADTIVGDRLRGQAYLLTASTAAESSATTTQLSYAYNNQVNPFLWTGGVSEVDWLFRRAPGFFDVVCYTGTGSARTVTHNLGVAPEMMIVKSRSGGRAWFVYHSGMVYSPYGADDHYALLNSTNGMVYDTTVWNSTYPTSTVFSVGAGVDTNQSGENLVAYLFATCPGVSKVGSYTGTGSTLQINCGFTGGARFVLIKQVTGSTDAWAVWDSARGIVAGNDPYLRLNDTAVEVTTTDWVDAYSLGFELSPSYNAFNVNTELYIFLAIA